MIRKEKWSQLIDQLVSPFLCQGRLITIGSVSIGGVLMVVGPPPPPLHYQPVLYFIYIRSQLP